MSKEIEKIWLLMDEIIDPEIPVLTVRDLGIIRDINVKDDAVEVVITPTYSGCPALDVIRMNIRLKLIEHGYKNISIKSVLSPAWTTEWMTEAGKQKLKAFGIAPPNPQQIVCTTDLFQEEESIQCPQCNSYQTRLISRFGSTPCKALYQCTNCLEPFDYFKCH